MIIINDQIFTLNHSKVAVLGAGISGIYAAVLAASLGADTILSDASSISLTPEQESLLSKNSVSIEEKGHSSKIFAADFVIKSPGIPNASTIIKILKNQDIPVIGEIEFAYQLLDTDKIVAITGSNGKTTTTMMVHQFLSAAKKSVFCGGNIGTPLSQIVFKEEITSDSIVVLEVSSFQLEDIVNFRPYVALFLNISEDHLDRYANRLEHYLQAKMRIAINQTAENFFIYNGADDTLIKNLPKTVTNRPFSLDNTESSSYLFNQSIYYKSEKLVNIADLKIKGEHNYQNLIAALQVCEIFDIKKEALVSIVKNFTPPGHRLEFVDTVNGVDYYNDSKATNIESVKMALTAFDVPVILILGGRDKDSDFSLLVDAIRKKVKRVILTGEAAEKIDTQFPPGINREIVTEFETAVKHAATQAKAGDVVLLSPACASFDAFKNFKARGRYFKKIVKDLNK